MSAVRGAWVESGHGLAARERLGRAVRALHRARWRQLAWDRLMVGLLVGLHQRAPGRRRGCHHQAVQESGK